ncbi:MAG TPA: aldehyde dehydrogenase family protein [Streptosporangiaceae bacterium]|nr:aldehyde dehydrogenase family protein [Streptosporangiaceae bacterium]
MAGVITPWNSPVVLTIRSLAPALAAGCTAVVKMPEQTAQINRLFMEVSGEVDDNSLSIVQEEVFGPVLTMQVFDTEAEAIALTNDSKYGLAASVWSRDVDQPLRVARELQAGTVWVNDWAKVYDEFEEGGYKESGQGRLNGSPRLRTSSSTSTSPCTRGLSEDALAAEARARAHLGYQIEERLRRCLQRPA